VDEPDVAEAAGVAVPEVEALTVVPGDRSRVGLVVAREQLDQRGLPRTVLTDQRVDLAGPHVEVDRVQGLRPGEGLGDVLEREDRDTMRELTVDVVDLGNRLARAHGSNHHHRIG